MQPLVDSYLPLAMIWGADETAAGGASMNGNNDTSGNTFACSR